MSDDLQHHNPENTLNSAEELSADSARQDMGEEEPTPDQPELHPSLEELVLDHERQLIDLGKMVESSHAESNEKLGLLGTAVSGVAEAVQKLTERPKASEPDEWNTKHLAGEATGQLLDKVRDWVDWYNSRYGTAESIRIRPCWYMHPPVVEEITALWVAWRAAYYGHSKPDTAATYWHSAYLWPTIKRIHTEAWGMPKCLAGHEHPRPVTSTSTSTDAGYVAVRAALTARTDTPVIPWPGQKQATPHTDSAPPTSPLPVQRPTFGPAR